MPVSDNVVPELIKAPAEVQNQAYLWTYDSESSQGMTNSKKEVCSSWVPEPLNCDKSASDDFSAKESKKK